MHIIEEMKKKTLIFIFLLSLSIRLFYLFFVIPIDWVGDSYHHWQIAWYTLNIGLSHGRLWDLKGCEYYWPPLPEFFEAFLMWIFHSPSILLMRIANTFISSLTITLCYIIGREYDEGVGASFSLAAAFFPFIINYDILALHEPLMIFFAFFGIWQYLKGNNFYAGLSIGLSNLCHFATYLLAPIFSLLYIIYNKSVTRLISFISGFICIYIPYMYMLFLHTGDALYNINFLIKFTLFGATGLVKYRSPFALIVGLLLVAMSIITMFFAYHRTSKYTPFVTIFSSYALFWGIISTLTGSIAFAYDPVRRYFVFQFFLIIFFLSIGLNRIRFLQSKISIRRINIPIPITVSIAFSIILLIASMPYYRNMQNSTRYTFEIADYVAQKYKGGVIISPIPAITYRLTDHWNIQPQQILGPTYCPPSYPEKLLWLQKHNVTLLLWVPGFGAMRVFPELGDGKDHPPLFFIHNFGSFLIYEVRW